MSVPVPEVVFGEIALELRDEGGPIKNSRLWTNEHVHHADLGRVHIRVVEATLSPTTSSREIMASVAFGFASQGLRVTQRDDTKGRISAQRIEAPYLASFSGRKSRSGMEKEEWRMVMATLGVSKNLAVWGGLERVLRLEFMTDPCPKENLAERSAAAVTSFTEWASHGISRSDSASSGPSAVMIARQRSNQRADALVKGVSTELNRLNNPSYPRTSRSIPASSAGAMGSTAAETQQDSSLHSLDESETSRVADLELVPWSRKSGISEKNNGSHAERNGTVDESDPSEAGVEVEFELLIGNDDDDDASRVFCSWMMPRSGSVPRCVSDPLPCTASATCATFCPREKVPVCLQFVEGLCARALELSRRDALETWKPLEQAVRQLERDSEHLRQLLEPKYQMLDADPPQVPTWSDRRGLGVSGWKKSKQESDAGSRGPGSRTEGSSAASVTGLVLSLIRLTSLFVVEESWVIAKVALANETSEVGDSNRPKPSPESVDGAQGSIVAGRGEESSGGTAIPATSPPVARAVVKALGDEILRLCEAKEEEQLKESMPGAQAYVAELEAYKSVIVSDKALQMGVLGAGEAEDEKSNSEVDDDLWRLFGAKETRLYSSQAALGRKPGRIFVTFKTLWFHSKVMGFESRHVLSLAEVKSVTVLGTALDISSSLVLMTRDGAEIMLVFPGTRMGALEPVALLLRQLALVAAEERTSK